MILPVAAGGRFLADTYTPPQGAHTIINLLAWCATAGGVFGLMVVGINMAIQLNRGDPGEGGTHFRGVFFVALACLIASTAGPLVSFLGDLSLLGP
ncbi:hypothetical protein [Streptomyces sp. NBC_01462]|uniref:hypothetical protein n=1 Tax=Streptomyces sp. NBC_01462 TaxID=2903876 RepID=UPI002E2F83B4|nr:hypothetical protein [Streptomyces sp. NBC_01462]